MKIEKIYNVNKIKEMAIKEGKNYNNGTLKEIAFNTTKNGIIEIKSDNKINTKFGDNRQGNYIYQVKSKNCELKLVKEIKEIATNFIELLNIYLKYEKANRYVYVIEKDNETYAITMNTKEFKEFVERFGRYSETRNNIRIKRSDNVIYNWATTVA